MGQIAYSGQKDEELVELVQKGDKRAQEHLFDKYKPLVKTRARTYFLIGADTEDIIQEGMIGLYKAMRDFQKNKNSSFRAFAELCINRQMITAIKMATRQKHIPLNSYISLNRRKVSLTVSSKNNWLFCPITMAYCFLNSFFKSLG